MKFILIFAFASCFFFAGAQNLMNTEWVRIKAQRKDGSTIIDHDNSDKVIVKYFFKDNTVLIATADQYDLETPYSVNDNILSFAGKERFKIDTITDIIFAITELPYKDLADDQLNSYIFISRKFLFDYLKENNQIFIYGDSLVLSTRKFSPIYKGSLSKLFENRFIYNNSEVCGDIIISSANEVLDVQINSKNDFSKKEIQNFIELLKKSKGYWKLPETPKPYKFKIDFCFKFTNQFTVGNRKINGTVFSLNNRDTSEKYTPSISKNDAYNSSIHFKNGNQFFNDKNYEKAVVEYTKCIEADSLFISGYYNLAGCYFELNNKKMACEIWQLLINMGQKSAMKLHQEYCK